MKLLIFGGSFNPIHIGHLIISKEILIEYEYDLLLFVPSLLGAYKEVSADPGNEHRLNMIRLAVKDNPKCIVDDCELLKMEYSRTITTVNELVKKYNSESKPGLILGFDLLESIHTWKDPDILARSSDIICARRIGNCSPKIDISYKMANNPIIEVSSTEIRKKISNAIDCSHFLNPLVYKYICENKLYGYEQNS